jgi:hypothetical protein
MTEKRLRGSPWGLLALAVLLPLCALVVCSRSEKASLSISWVSTDRSSFEPEKDENVVIRYRLSRPASVTVRITDPFGNLVRTILQENDAPGDQSVSWDGRDEGGNPVPPEAYAYTIAASSKGWFGSTTETTYDLGSRTGGQPVRVHSVEWSPDSGRISYVVPKPSRVRLVLGRKDTGWPLGIALDWEPRWAGKHTESLSDWDIDGIVEARGFDGLSPVFQAFSLPDNVVITQGSEPENPGGDSNTKAEKVPHRLARDGSESLSHQHARHPRERCFSPTFELSFPDGTEAVDGVFHLGEPTPIRVDISSEESRRRLPPIPRPAVFLYIDEVLVEKNLDGYVPYQWILEPKLLGPGEHWLSVFLSWQEDHFGVRHIRVKAKR